MIFLKKNFQKPAGNSIFSGRDRGKMVYYRQYAKGRRNKIENEK